MGNHCHCKRCNEKEDYQAVSFHEEEKRINNQKDYEYSYNFHSIIQNKQISPQEDSNETIEHSINKDEKIIQDYIIPFINTKLNKQTINSYSASNSGSTNNTNSNNNNNITPHNINSIINNNTNSNSNISFNPNSPCLNPHLETICELNNENVTLLSRNDNLCPSFNPNNLSTRSNNIILNHLQNKSRSKKNVLNFQQEKTPPITSRNGNISNSLCDSSTKNKTHRPSLHYKNKSRNKKVGYQSIEEIIPKSKIESNNRNEILYQGDLLKYSKNADYRYAHMLTFRFIILTKKELKIYRSKELFLGMKSPLLCINIKNIIKVERTEIVELLNQKKKEYFCFYIEYFSLNNISNNNFMNGQICPSFDISLSKIANETESQGKINNNSKSIESFFKECNDYNYSIKKKLIKGKKMHLINTSEKNSLDEDTLFKSSIEGILLASEIEDDVDKWIFILNYMINEYVKK